MIKVVEQVSIGPEGKLKCVQQFCYLGDMLGAGGGAVDASRARVRCAWCKFRELSSILTARRVSLRLKGKCTEPVCSLCWCMEVKHGQRR